MPPDTGPDVIVVPAVTLVPEMTFPSASLPLVTKVIVSTVPEIDPVPTNVEPIEPVTCALPIAPVTDAPIVPVALPPDEPSLLVDK